MLRIVHCFRSPVGGIFRHVRDLVDAQIEAGHAVGIVCDSTTGGDFEDALFRAMEPKLALGIRRTPMQRHIGPGDLHAAWRSYGLIKELRPDVLHGHGAKGGVYARVFGSLLRVSRSRVARIYSPHGGSLHYDERTPSGRAIFAIERLLEQATDHILFVSDHERRTFSRKIGKPTVPNSLVYNGLRDAEFEPAPAGPEAADLLYIGMMRDLKGPDLFLQAMAAAEHQLERPIRAEMVGDGQDLDRYKAMTRELGLEARVRFRPPMPARQAFALAELVVVPSRAEALPYIVLEALAAGKPMIATAVGGIPEIFGQGSPALVLPTAEQISARLVTVLADPAAYAALMPSREELRARFSVHAMAAAVETAYTTAFASSRNGR